MEFQDDCPPFWREITLRAATGRVDAELIDNVHHFAVTLNHDGERVIGVNGRAVRVPWVTCPGAIKQLSELEGTPVEAGSRVNVDQSQHCTHLLDLARAAIAQIPRGGTRRYEVSIQFDQQTGLVAARLERNREPMIDWMLKDGIVVSPGPFEGHNTQGRSIWSETVHADAELVEAGLILRRAVYIFRSRCSSEPLQRAADVPGMSGVCYSFQPGLAALALRPTDFVELPARAA